MKTKIFLKFGAGTFLLGGLIFFVIQNQKVDRLIYIDEDVNHVFSVHSKDLSTDEEGLLFEFRDVPLYHRMLMKQLLWENVIDLVKGKQSLERFNQEKKELFALLASPETEKEAGLGANTNWVMNDQRDIFAIHLAESRTKDLRIVFKETGKIQDVGLLDRLSDPIDRLGAYDFLVDSIDGESVFLRVNDWPIPEQESVTTFVEYNFVEDTVDEYFHSDFLTKDGMRYGFRQALNSYYVLAEEDNREGFLLKKGSDQPKRFSFHDLEGSVLMWGDHSLVKKEREYIVIEDQFPDEEERRVMVMNPLNSQRTFINGRGEVNNFFKKGDGIVLGRRAERENVDGPSNVNGAVTLVKEYEIYSPETGKQMYSFKIQDSGSMFDRSFVGIL